MGTILPLSSYPSELDTNKTLFQVYNTSETVLSQALLSWQTTIYIVPVKSGKPELWADSGYVTIEGELIYYSGVTRVSGAVTQFNSCIRRVNGTPPKNNPVGTSVRGFVIAEHHNNLARALVNIESFVGITNSTDKESIIWKLNYINSLLPYTDDAGCPQLEFYYTIISEDPIRGTEIFYNLTINSSQEYTGFVINFGDGTNETELLSGTHFYTPNKKIQPVATVNAPGCDAIQTSAQSISLDDLQQVNLITITDQPINVPAIPDFPNFSLSTVNDVPDAIQFPPIVFPCLDIGPFGPIVIPSSISLINADAIPSVITFQDPPEFPSNIIIQSDVQLPSIISIIADIPTSIVVYDNIPSIVDVNTNLPSVISIISPSNISVSLIAPSVISLSPSVIQVNSNIPSVITVNDIDIAVSLTSDYCTNCTGSIQTNAPNTVGGPTDVGCNVCAGANQKIKKVTVVLHDFMVQTFNAPVPYTRYDLIKILLVDPTGNTCLLMGGAAADATSIPQFIMNEPVTLTFDDASTNNIYDFSVPLQTGTYAPNANGNTTSRSAGQVNIGTPAPAPSGFNGYGSNLSVFTDKPLVQGAWNVYVAAGPVAPTYQNLVYLGSACARINSDGELPCEFPTPTPSPCGATPKPTKTPAPTPRRTNAPTATPAGTPPNTPQPTPNRTPSPTTPYGPGGDPWPGTGGGGGIIVPVDPGRPIPVTPKPTKTPKPTPAPTPLPNCGSCDFKPSLENCGAGVCTYYWNFTSSSWSRCTECQSCTAAGGNCNCPEARWLVSYGILPVDGSKNPTVNTNCYEFTWSNNTISTCDGFCTYYFTPSTGLWSYEPDASYCPSTSGCECQPPEVLVQKGILNKNPGTNKTQHTKCYTTTAISKCNAGCECPPAPTLQAITSTNQIISKSCVPECGTCIDEYITDLNNPCDPDPTDYTCVYEYTSTFGWRIEPVSHCNCDNMDCLSADAAKNAGLFPDAPSQGELVYLSCYGGAWYNYDFCNPDANCKCPPTPTPPPAGQQPADSFLVNQCINPTPTPSPTAGCGDCTFTFDAPVCGSGNCTYTYYSDLLQWTVGGNCGSSLCNCMNVEDAQFMGLLPDNPGDGEQVNTPCYFYSSSQQALEGTWNFSGDTCTTDCGCLDTASYSGFGYFPGQVKLSACVPKPSPTPTPSPTGPVTTPLPTLNCGTSSCSYVWAGTNCGSGTNNCSYQKSPSGTWQFVTGLCTGGCTCPSVANLTATINSLAPGTTTFTTGCVSPNGNSAGSFVISQNNCTNTGCVCPQLTGNYADLGFFVTTPCERTNCENTPCSNCQWLCDAWSNQWVVYPAGAADTCKNINPNCGCSCSPPQYLDTATGIKYPSVCGMYGVYGVPGTFNPFPNTYGTFGSINNSTCSTIVPAVNCNASCTWQCLYVGSSGGGNPIYSWLVSEGNCQQVDGTNCICTYPQSPCAANVPSSINSKVTTQCSPASIPPYPAPVINPNPASESCKDYNGNPIAQSAQWRCMQYMNQYLWQRISFCGAGYPGCNPLYPTQSCSNANLLQVIDFPCGIPGNPNYFPTPLSAFAMNLEGDIFYDVSPHPQHLSAMNSASEDVEYIDNKVELVEATRPKFCKYADRKPLQMIKENCGTCAIRKCDKFGLCSHTGVIEGRDDVVCCQLCDAYEEYVEPASPTATPYVEHTPVPTPPPSITPIDSDILKSNEVLKTTIAQISKDRVKLCQFAEKEPLKMIKQGCGTCAIRKCEKFGLCSHTSIIEGHPEVICCQNCTAYSSDKLGTIKSPPQKNNPASHGIANPRINSNQNQIAPIVNEILSSSEIAQIHDPVTMAENITNDGNVVKIVPKDAVINVNVDELVRGRKTNEKE